MEKTHHVRTLDLRVLARDRALQDFEKDPTRSDMDALDPPLYRAMGYPSCTYLLF
jgi:hypothetical protein